MTPEQLKTTRISWKYSQAEMAELLHTKLRTYQDWEAGKGRIPGLTAALLGLFLERDQRITREILERAALRISAEYPAGIPSAPEPEEEA
jgi:DNA-binding XRE family transcriptional regulator